jgi:WD40 repeat protein
MSSSDRHQQSSASVSTASTNGTHETASTSFRSNALQPLFTPHPADDISSIVHEAQRNATRELRSTQEILKLAGAVLKDRNNENRGGASNTYLNGILSSHRYSSNSFSPSAADVYSTTLMGLGSLDEGDTNFSSIPEYSNLPGKYTLLSSNSMELSGSNKTLLLSRIDGLANSPLSRVKTDDSSASGRLDKQLGVGDVLASVASAQTLHSSGGGIRSQSDVNAAIENAMKARIKGNHSKRYAGATSIQLGESSMLEHKRISSEELPRLPSSSHSMMPDWVSRKINAEAGVSPSSSPKKDVESYFGQYTIHPSETIITHELSRGDWTWTTEWSPCGKFLAVATENHSFAIVDAGNNSPVWKVIYDGRIGKLKNDTTHTVRSIAWGANFIALGGTGDAVTIVEPSIASKSSKSNSNSSSSGRKHSFRTVDVITDTGFVGALHWRKNSNILAIGSREDQCLIVGVTKNIVTNSVSSSILCNIERNDWVNAVRFSPGGTKLAIGDKSGLLSIYLYVMLESGEEGPSLSLLKDIIMDDNILDVQWSPDTKYIYVGGEDYSISVIDALTWEFVHRIGRDRWVPFLTPSKGGSHLAVGGGSSHVSLIDTKQQWKEVTSFPVEGGIPLSAKWHPKDLYLAISGQFNEITIYETSCRRLLKGKCLRSKTTILAVEFSPNGNVIAVGNETGLITFFDNQSPTFVTIYETCIGTGGDVAIRWTSSGKNVAIFSGATFVLLDTIYCGKSGLHPQSSSRFLVRKIVQGGINFVSMSLSPKGEYVALTDDTQTRILDINNNCKSIRTLEQHNVFCTGWSPNGLLFASVGKRGHLIVYDSKSSSEEWPSLFSITVSDTIEALCWGPSSKKSVQYLAFGGEERIVTIIEVRSFEKAWETVLQLRCGSNINDLDWNERGLLCIGDDEGSVSVVDLSYLKSGRRVSEMNYNWQRQGIICTVKLSRNFGRNAITSIRWPKPSLGRDNSNLLAVGGSDGIVEIVDLSDRSKLESAN